MSPDPGAAFLQNVGIALLHDSTGPPAPPSQTLLQKDFAAALDVNQSTIAKYINRGMPTISIDAAKDWRCTGMQCWLLILQSSDLVTTFCIVQVVVLCQCGVSCQRGVLCRCGVLCQLSGKIVCVERFF